MLVDSRRHIRELAVRRIQKARLQNSDRNRVFKVPSINVLAEDYIDLIDWQNYIVTEPPVTVKLSNKDLENIVKETFFVKNLGKFPCHTQAVERCVKIITEAALKVCGETSRDGYIRSKLEGRKLLPSFENKARYLKKRSKSKYLKIKCSGLI